jgi:hypothetical protein
MGQQYGTFWNFGLEPLSLAFDGGKQGCKTDYRTFLLGSYSSKTEMIFFGLFNR